MSSAKIHWAPPTVSSTASASRLRILIFLALLTATCFSAWSQPLYVQVTDAKGLPIERALVQITYQNASAVTDSDGSITGYTGSNGFFIVNLTNKVPAEFEVRSFKVKVSNYYWAGETRSSLAGNSTYSLVNFTAPYELEKITIWVLDFTNLSLQGADVFVAEAGLQKKTATSGTVQFLLPTGLPFSGYAAYGALNRNFGSDEIKSASTGKFIKVQLPESESEQETNSTNSTGITFRATFAGPDGMPLAGQPVRVSVNNTNGTVVTDASGSISVSVAKKGVPVRLVARKNGYDYIFNYVVNSSMSEQLVLVSLLKINSLTSAPEGNNCYLILANVTDPRPQLPLDVRMARYGPTINTTLQVAVDSQGLFTSRICVQATTQVRVTATNKYESAEKVVDIAYVPPAPPPPPIVKNITQPTPQQSIFTPEVIDGLFSTMAIGIVVGFAAIFFFGRRYLSRVLRFIAEYLRQAGQRMQKKRPTTAPPVQPQGGKKAPASDEKKQQ